MNKQQGEHNHSYRSLLLLDEISKRESLSQRDLSRKLNIALGLVNTYLKNMVSKGYVKIKAIPSRRYAYYLTPKGFTEKTLLTYRLLQEYTGLYREARKDFQKLFRELKATGVRRVAFAGTGEIAEIAYLSLQEVDLELIGVYSEGETGKFFKKEVKPISRIAAADFDCVVVVTYTDGDAVHQTLLECGVPAEKIHTMYPFREAASSLEGLSGGEIKE